jgi:hypothetical protein
MLFLFSSKIPAEEPKTEVMSGDIISACRTGNIDAFESVVHDYHADNNQLGAQLLMLLKSTQSNFSQSASAYFLGEIHYTNSVDALAAQIAFRFHGVIMKHLVEINIPEYPAMDALVKIGTPSIPVAIQNLAESDDAQVRDLSLQVLNRIENDKDIVRLRLQKALQAEADPQKHMRLQTALKSLSDLE